MNGLADSAGVNPEHRPGIDPVPPDPPDRRERPNLDDKICIEHAQNIQIRAINGKINAVHPK